MKALIFDTETTDLVQNSLMPLKAQPKVIEFFGHVIDLDTGAIAAELDTLIYPGEKITDKITEITTITNEMLSDQKPFSHYAETIQGMMTIAETVIAHNLAFDMAVINAEMARLNLVAPWPPTKICTVEATEYMKGYRLRLGDLHSELFGSPFEGAHRARVDVEALTRCCLELRKRDVI